jgi:hypothetical protein
MTSRPLTKGEIALARTVFGTSVDYDTVTISDQKFMGLDFLPKGTAMAPNGNIFMPGCYREDFSTEETLMKSVFIHEMTHVWQYQNKILNPIASAAQLAVKHKFNYQAAYDYRLDGKKDLLDYNMEQQAAIVQDYFAMKQDGSYAYWGCCQNDGDDTEKRQLFEKVLEKFTADPGYAKSDAFPRFGLKKPKPKQPPKAA